MTTLELYEGLKPYQKAIIAVVPLVGIVVGWFLKTIVDLFLKTKDDWSKRRECIFYLLQSWKNILDYERYISSLSKQDIDIREYEKNRIRLSVKLRERLLESKNSLQSGIVSLASVDPCSAAQLDNTLKNFLTLLDQNWSELIDEDPAYYQSLNKEFYDQIEWTLSDMSHQAERLASKSGLFQRRRTSKWFDARIKGGAEFHAGVEEIEKDADTRRA